MLFLSGLIKGNYIYIYTYVLFLCCYWPLILYNTVCVYTYFYSTVQINSGDLKKMFFSLQNSQFIIIIHSYLWESTIFCVIRVGLPVIRSQLFYSIALSTKLNKLACCTAWTLKCCTGLIQPSEDAEENVWIFFRNTPTPHPPKKGLF